MSVIAPSPHTPIVFERQTVVVTGGEGNHPAEAMWPYWRRPVDRGVVAQRRSPVVAPGPYLTYARGLRYLAGSEGLHDDNTTRRANIRAQFLRDAEDDCNPRFTI